MRPVCAWNTGRLHGCVRGVTTGGRAGAPLRSHQGQLAKPALQGEFGMVVPFLRSCKWSSSSSGSSR
eukprot:5264633-Lingulodinium_polyedra.AAC.1